MSTFFQGSHANEHITWTFPANFVLEPGETTYLTFTARVPADVLYETSARTMRNLNTEIFAQADTMLSPANGKTSVTLTILSPFDKSVTTPPVPGSNRVFPNRYITYTVTIYNPLQVPVNNVVFTDTLEPTSLFTYSQMVSGPEPVRIENYIIQWEGINITANGIYTLAFQVYVPPETPLKFGCGGYSYYNQVHAAHPGFPRVYPGHNSNKLAPVTVTPQLRPRKTVDPSLQLPGQIVTYTISLQNLGDTTLHPEVITDTLPASFTYVEMAPDSPLGEPVVISNTLRWEGIPAIPPGETFEFSFLVRVDGPYNTTFYNYVSGEASDTSFCEIRGGAVKIDVPFRMNKTANPTAVVQGETVDYTASIHNIAPTLAYSITHFIDILPDGFIDVTDLDGIYEYTITPPFVLEPDIGSTWVHTFTARVVGEGIGTAWCESLKSGSRNFSQAKGNVIFTIYPDDIWFNPTSLAPVNVTPHAFLSQEAYPNPVALNETLVLTLTLHDNRNNPPGDITGATLEWTAPSSGEEQFIVLDSDPPYSASSAHPDYIWEGLTIPADGETHVVLTLQAPDPQTSTQARNYSSVARVAALDDMSICIPSSTYTLKVERGIEIDKTPTPSQVGPYGTVEYQLRVRNYTAAPVEGIIITDTLPTQWEYIETVSGPEPVSLDPLVWHIDLIEGNASVYITFRARAYTLLGNWYNQVDGAAPINIRRINNYDSRVEVFVVAGVGFFKDASPNVITAGESTIYTLNLYNGSATHDMTNIIITDTLPSGFTFDGMIQGSAPIQNGQELIWHIPGTLKRGNTYQLIFRASTPDTLPSGIYYNQAIGYAESVQNGGPVYIPPTELSAPVEVIGVPSVLADKSVTPQEVTAGNPVTYTVTLLNETDESYTLRITDTLPYHFTFVQALDRPEDTVIPGNRERVVWSGFSIAPQETLVLTFQAQPDASAPGGVYCNDIQVQMGDFVLPPRLNLACVDVLGLPQVDAQIDKDDGQEWVQDGQLITYTITYTNAAGSDLPLENIVITDTITPLEYLTVLGGPGWQDLGDGVYRLEIPGSLAPDASGQVTFAVQLADSLPPDAVVAVINTVTIGYTTSEPAVESNPEDNTARDVNIWQGPDLVLSNMQVIPDTITLGESVQVRVVLTNQGNQDITRRHDGSGEGGWLFLVELYAKHETFTPSGPPQSVYDHLGGYCIDAGCDPGRYEYLAWPGALPAGESIVLVYDITPTRAGDYQLYGQADVTWEGWLGSEPFGFIREAVEDNNILTGPTLQVIGLSDQPVIYLPLVMRGQ